MRLTLRTLLAYLDDALEPGQARLIGQKVAESDAAQELIGRIIRWYNKEPLHGALGYLPPIDYSGPRRSKKIAAKPSGECTACTSTRADSGGAS